MSIFKCKMCGGTLEIQAGSTVAECEYCGTKQTLPNLNDEKRVNLYDRANHFRRSNEFDKAAAMYEQILNEDGNDAETYWSLVLCRYGIEYVEDPLSHRRVPTVHRAQFTSIFDDDNYKSALQFADSYQRIIYEEEAKAINEIQKGILAISGQEEPFDIFICYKETDESGQRTHDSVLAQDLYYQLKQEGFKVFFARITLEDKLGSAYEPYIFAALNSAKVMVVLGTKPEHFNAVWVRNEWSRFLALIKSGEKKMLIPAYRDMDPYDLPKEFSHLQAQDMSKLGFMQDLIRGIKKIIGKEKKPEVKTVERVVVQSEAPSQDTAPLLRRTFLFLEDGEFDNAAEYAEKVLDINPECAEAYFAKLLIDLRLKKPEHLANYRTPVTTAPNYQKAIRFASPEYKATLEGYNKAIIDRIDNSRKDEIYNRGVELMRMRRYDEAIQFFQKVSSYKDAAQKIEDCKKSKENDRLESIYSRAVSLLSNKQFDEAAKLFASIPDYKDAKKNVEVCAERKEIDRKDTIYAAAMRRVMPKEADDAAIKKSISELQTIAGYKDTDNQVKALSTRLEKWYADKKAAEEEARIKAEEERRERERQAEIRRMKKAKRRRNAKIAAAIVLPLMAVCAIFLILVFTLVIPLIRYNQAGILFNEGKYDEAMEIYQDINGYFESGNRISVLNGIDQIEEAELEEGVKTILSAGVPVKITYAMEGGDFSGKNYLNVGGGFELLNSNGGSAAAPETVEYTYTSGADFAGLQTPGRSGYRFVEWELDSYSYTIGETFELKLTAIWSVKEYTIEYFLEGGTGSSKNPVEYSVIDSSFTLVNPTRAGYTFIGWTGTGLNTLTMTVTIEKGSTGNRSYKANWVANTYNITFNANDGTVSTDSMTVTFDTNVALPIPTRTGYTFAGWFSGNTQYMDGTWSTASDVKLTARWAANSYTVTYVYDDGTTTPVTVKYGENVTLPELTKTGYTFLGWYEGETKYESGVWTTLSDVTLTPMWEANTNTITLDVNGGTVSDTSVSVIYDQAYTLPTPTRTGYTFGGWYNGDTQYTSGTWDGLEDVTLTARWTANSYNVTLEDTVEIFASVTVTFNYNYSGSTDSTVTLTNGQTLSYPTVPTRTGYAFAGWYTDSSCATRYSFSGTITDDITLYAKWVSMNSSYYTREYVDIANYNYSYQKSYSVTASYSSSPNYYYFTCYTAGTYTFYATRTSGDYYIYVYNATQGTYIISGYNLYGSYSSKSATFSANAGDVIYVYLFKYSSGGSSGGGTFYVSGASYPTSTATASCGIVNSYVYESGTSSSITVNYDATVTLPELSRTGYTFLGWYNGEELVESGTWTLTEDVTLTPMWEAAENTLTFDANGGTVSDTSITVTYGEEFTLPTPTRTGYTFEGWFDGETQYTSGTWDEFDDVTLTARWTVNSYDITFGDTIETVDEITVTFNYNYSGYTDYTVTLTNGQTLSRPDTPSLTGYVFTGWYLDSECTERYDFTGTIEEDMTLYAGWQSMYSTYYSRSIIDPSYYNSSNVYYVYTASSYNYGYSSSYTQYIYLVAQESGTHYIYYKNGSSSTYYLNYIGITNLTTGETIKSNSTYSSTYYDYYSFYCEEGDVIAISVCAYYYGEYAYFYFSGFGSVEDSSATASCGTVSGYVYEEGESTTITVEYGTTVTLPELYRTGYTFLGWYNGEELVESGEWTFTDDVTLTPMWEAGTHAITFDPNGGSMDSTSMGVTFGSDYTLPTPTKTGYTFSGWYLESGEQVTDGTWDRTESISVVARWTITEYQITYELDGGTNAISNPSSYTINDSIIIVAPTKTGYTFLGWTYEGQDTPQMEISISINSTEDKTFTANWQANSYTVTLNANGGTCDQTTLSVTYDADCTLPTPTRVGYTFLGWYNGDELVESGAWQLTSNATLTAAWEIVVYDIIYNVENAEHTNPATYTVNDSIVLVAPARVGYTFLGWTYEGQDTPVMDVTIASGSEGNLTFTAVWEAHSFTVTLDPNGGSCDETTITIYFDDTLTLPEVTRTGYTFLGWFLGETKIESGIWQMTEDATLVAAWSANQYNVTFDNTEEVIGNITVTLDNNDGTTPTTVTLSNGDTLEYPTVPTRSGYAFAGWYLDSECTEFYTFSGEITEDFTLYAKWVAMNSSYTSSEYFDIANYNSSESKKEFTVSASYSSSPNYYYFTCYEAGTYSFYVNWTSGDYYVYMYNVTRGTYLISGWNIYSNNSYGSTSFTAQAGDVIYLLFYKYNSSGSTGYGTFYVDGLTYPTSSATASCPNSGDYIYSSGSTANVTVEYGTEVTLPTPTRTGYTFLGWYNGDVLFESGTWETLSNVTLVPRWETTRNTITFDANGGTMEENSMTVTYGASYTLPELTRTGYNFLGWYLDDEQFTDGVWLSESDITLVAKWEALQFDVTFEDVEIGATVTFDNNDGTETVTTVTLADGDTLNYPTAPTRSGYVFTGWYLDSECTERYDFTGTIEGDMTLYAGWEAMHTTYYSNTIVSIPSNYSSYTNNAYSVCSYSSYYSGYNASYAKFIYLVAQESGNHTIYYRNGYSSSSYANYIGITNLTTGTTIKSNGTCTNTSFYSYSFDCNAGDVIVISVCAYYYGEYAYFYFDGFSTPTSSAVAELTSWSNSNYSEDNDITVTIDYGTDVTLPVLTRPGYTFLGWYNGDELVEDGAWSILSDVTLTPMWEIIENTITLDANGGESGETSITITYGEDFTLPTPTRTGYTFEGWFNGETEYVSGTWAQEEDVTLTAKWTVNTYNVTFGDLSEVLKDGVTVTFDHNYEDSTPTTETVANGEILSYPTIPTRSGHVFAGWYVDSECTEIYDFSGEITEDITLYAYWIEVEADGIIPTDGSNFEVYIPGDYVEVYYAFVPLVSGTVSYNTIQYTSGFSVELCDADKNELGIWSNAVSGSTTLTAGTVYYIKYSTGSARTITISLSASVPTSSATANCTEADGYVYEDGASHSVTVDYNESLTLPTPTRTGYTFLGWYNGEELVESGAWTILSDVTLTAMWQANENTLTLDANGGTVSDATVTVTYDSEFTLPTPTRTGYTFGGWFSGETEYVSGTWDELADVTLTAMWTANSYTVTYDDTKANVTVTLDYNYSDSTSSTVTLAHGQTFSYPTVPTRSGYAFAGWYLDSECTEFYTFSGEITEDFTLYAKWVAMTSSYYSREYVDIANYNSASAQKGFTVTSYSSGNHYYYFTCYEAGSYTFYATWTGGDYYIYMYNATQSTYIISGYNMYGSHPSKSASFTANAGDVIYVYFCKYSSGSSTGYGTFYVDGLTYPTSTATSTADEYVYADSATTSITVTYDQAYTLPTPTRTGYTFLGWYNGETLVESGTWNTLSDVTLTPMWQANTNTITFDANGGTVSDTAMTVTYDSAFTLPTPTRTGYTFGGWFSGETEYTSGTWDEHADVSLTAMWTANSYNVTLDDTKQSVTVTYDYNYSDSTSTTVTVSHGQTLSRPTTPTRSGYVFAGWYTDSDCTEEYDFTGTIEGDMTLYAGWEAQYSGGYSHTIIDPTTYNSSSYPYSISNSGTSSSYQKYLYLIANESGTHYIYYANSTSSSSYKTYIGATNLTTGTTIKSTSACSSTSYNYVSFTCNAGDVIVINLYYYSYSATAYFYFVGFGSPAASTAIASCDYAYADGETSSITVTYDQAYTLPTPTRTGYTFLGWYNGETLVESGTWNTLSDVTLTAMWQANSYTATFDANGGEVTQESMTVTYDSAYTLPTPTRTGYTFTGWYSGETLYTGEAWQTAADTTLTAQWTANTDINYVVNHYQQNVDNDEYTLESTEALQGTADATITPDVKSYDYFVSPSAQTVTVAPDGTLVVNYYYDRETFDVTYVTNGGEEITTQTYKYGQKPEITTPTRTDYTFGGWFTDVNLATEYSAPDTLTADVTIYAYWTEENKPSDFTYSGTDAITVSAYNGTSTTLWIPAYIGGVPVTTIPNYAFQNKTDIVKVVVPETVTYIGVAAFYGCNAIEEMTLPFMNNSATSTNRFSKLFRDTNNNSYVPSSVKKVTITVQTAIPTAAFYGCNYIEEINIPEGTMSIGTEAFSGCSALLRLNSETDGVFNVPEGVTQIQNYAFYKCSLAETINLGESVVSIGYAAFYQCNSLTSFVIPETVETIGDYAFYECVSLVRINSDVDGELNIPESVKSIGYQAFKGLAGITKVYIPETVTSLGTAMFQDCTSIEELTLPFLNNNATDTDRFSRLFRDTNNNDYVPASVKKVTITAQTAIPSYAFDNCKYIEEINIPATTTSIGSYAFNGCSALLRLNSETDGEFNVPEGVTQIQSDIFHCCLLAETINLGENVTSIGSGAFYQCKSLTSFTIPETVEMIDGYAFYECVSLVRINSEVDGELNIPESVKSIGYQAFKGLAGITKVYIPETVTSLGAAIFENCTSIEELTLPFMNNTATDTDHFSILFKNTNNNSGYVPSSIKKVTITVQTAIPNSAFADCKYIEEINIPANTTSIGSYAFYNCSALLRLNSETDGVFNIPENITIINYCAFENCLLVEEFVLGTCIEKIDSYAFKGCKSLSKFNSTEEGTLIIPDKVSSVGYAAFENNISITKVVVPESVYIIHDRAFYGCSAITEMVLPFVGCREADHPSYAVFGAIFGQGGGSVQNYGYTWYYIPTSIRKVTITAQTAIPNCAFRNCNFIETIVLPSTVTSVGEDAFYNCSAEVSYTYTATASVWNGTDVSSSFLGSGTEDDPYQINSAADLAFLASSVNAGTNYSDKYFVLNVDINLSDKSWTPIGTKTAPFAGTFDGNGKEISNISVSNNVAYAGLFGYVSGTIKNLGVLSGIIAPSTTAVNAYAGGMVGYLTGTVENCYSQANVSLNITNIIYAGGLIGYVDATATVSDSYAYGSAFATSSSGFAYAGGFAGVNKGTIEGCLAFGNVKAYGSNDTYSRNGGFVAINDGTLTECYRSETQVLTKYTTTGAAYCEAGTTDSYSNMIDYAQSNWADDLWEYDLKYPNHK